MATNYKMTHRDIYYKATRMDGTDFRTGKVKYEVGKRVRPLPHDGERELCGPGYLHASDVPSETLPGGWWPCRLFEVKGKPADGFRYKFMHKGGFKQLTVVREIEAWQALGPNGREVAELIERAGRLTTEESRKLSASRVIDWLLNCEEFFDREVDKHAARKAIQYAAWNNARVSARDAARDAVGKAIGIPFGSVVEVIYSDAVQALVVRDLIPEEYFNVLHGPWKAAVG